MSRGSHAKALWREDARFHSYIVHYGYYEAAEVTIQGYIRKLPAGQKASEEARTLAENLGYGLEPNETYVRPFIRQVFPLKERTETSGTTTFW